LRKNAFKEDSSVILSGRLGIYDPGKAQYIGPPDLLTEIDDPADSRILIGLMRHQHQDSPRITLPTIIGTDLRNTLRRSAVWNPHRTNHPNS
jgi:hypothetical protein